MSSDTGKSDSATAVPRFAPVLPGVKRPLWSVMIPAFNCVKYLRETLESVLAQDFGPEQMQKAVVDGCSTKDDSEAVVNEIGRKPSMNGVAGLIGPSPAKREGPIIFSESIAPLIRGPSAPILALASALNSGDDAIRMSGPYERPRIGIRP
jgi:glycosyltransferase involved in cell wall biosynthesis